jgi:hypothetical protein
MLVKATSFDRTRLIGELPNSFYFPRVPRTPLLAFQRRFGRYSPLFSTLNPCLRGAMPALRQFVLFALFFMGFDTLLKVGLSHCVTTENPNGLA